jgi:hypothetical protein
MKAYDRTHRETKKQSQGKFTPPPAPKINNFYFDPASFEKTIADDCEAAFRAYQERYKGERFYTYGLRTHRPFELLYPVAVTEEMLDRYVEHEIAWHAERYKGMSRSNIRWFHRFDHNIEDELQYNLTMSHEFGFFGYIASAALVLPSAEVDRLEAEHSKSYIEACLNALRSLDKKGVFGDEATRSRVTLFFEEGHSHFLPVNCVDVLNPPDVFTRYRVEKAKADSFDPYRRRSV